MPFDEGSLFDGLGDFVLPPRVPVGQDGYLGRFQVGQNVPLQVTPLDNAGFPTPPDFTPTYAITDADGNPIASGKLAMRGDGEHFGLEFFIGVLLDLGTYSITYSYVVAGITSTVAGSFDLIQGGDPGGSVISMYAYDRPEAQFVIAQLDSGVLVMGKNPKL